MCKNLKYGQMWDPLQPVGKNGGMLIAWNPDVQIKCIKKIEFCYEVQVELDDFEEPLWVIFVYDSTYSNERKARWEYLV